MDNTWTLTYGTPEVVDIHPAEGVPVVSLQAAAIAESRSEPVGRAILKKASGMGVSTEEPKKFEYTPGKGIVATRDGVEIILTIACFSVWRDLLSYGKVTQA